MPKQVRHDAAADKSASPVIVLLVSLEGNKNRHLSLNFMKRTCRRNDFKGGGKKNEINVQSGCFMA